MPTQTGVVAHYADIHRLTDMNARQLGFFEVTINVVGAAVDHREHGFASTDKFMGARRAVVQVAIDRAAHH
ncbi:hypothetical protein D3C79_955840 [compost metagenome]